eukprot:1147830-Pelagomonas_calceolata.AAC.1
MHGSHHAHHFQNKIRSANPLDLSQLVVDLRSLHVTVWRQFLVTTHEAQTAKTFTYHHWCALPTKPARVTHSPYILPKYFYLDLSKLIVPRVARFRLYVLTLKIEQATWDDTISPACDLCDAQDDVQDEQYVLFKCTHRHVWSLRLGYASLFSGPLLSLSLFQ